MLIILVMAMAVSSAHAHDPLENTCIGNDNLYLDHKCYTRSMQELNFHQANQYCRAIGGARRSHLAYITSSALVEKMTEKWPELYPQQSSTQHGGLRIAAAVQNKWDTTYPPNSIMVLHDVVWYGRYDSEIEYDEVFANQTYLMQMLRSDTDTIDNTKNACILLERSPSLPQYRRCGAPCDKLSSAVLCQRDNLLRRFKKVAQGRKFFSQYQAEQVKSLHVCIEKCSTDVMCQAFSVKKAVDFVKCGLSATKMVDSDMRDAPGVEIWESA